MKNRVLRAVLLGASIGGLVVATTPAQAATVTWDDPAGDAVTTPLPNEPAYDITTVKISNDGGNLTWENAVPGLIEGAPFPSTGYTFRMLFTHGDVTFRFQVTEDILGQQKANVAVSGGTVPAGPLECEKCEGKIDRESKKVVFTAPLASLDKALQSAEAPPLAGQEWTALSVTAGRPISAPNPANLPVSGVQLTTETAAAPEGTTLKF